LVAEATLPAQQEIAKVERRQGYGFLVDQSTLPAQQRHTPDTHDSAEAGHLNRRAADVAEEAVRVGRRNSDRATTPVAADTSIRVNVEKVDQLINLVGELVITQAMLAQSASEMDSELVEKLLSGLHQLERNTRDLQEVVMSVRMLPISFVFSRYPRVVRDLAGKLGKQVDLKTVGEGTELDKGLIEKIADPLTHLVRNSLDHGIESPDKRTAAGKSAKGTITLAASHQGGNVVIEVSDDGAGLNRGRILNKAHERGLPVREDITDQEVWMLIFEPGFSTAEVVTDVSGRGVGMDVVKRNISALGGRIELNSVEGLGTRITIRLPLTLAILDGLSVDVGGETYIIPLTNIIESLLVGQVDMRSVSGEGQMIHVRGEYLPLVSMRDLFNLPSRLMPVGGCIVVIVEAEGSKVALLVDDLLGQHQVVIKSLESNYRKLPGISGATIMGNGKVALILDVAALVLTPSMQNRLAA
jgi:two-component system chemotaxis sensor kinase CheA